MSELTGRAPGCKPKKTSERHRKDMQPTLKVKYTYLKTLEYMNTYIYEEVIKQKPKPGRHGENSRTRMYKLYNSILHPI
jgi:hypothetical protein